jgi:ComF family protein
VDLILPLPLSAKRLQERGYNQAWLLSRALQHAMGVPACHDALHRVRDTHRLMRLDAEARREAIAGAFAISPGGARRVQGRRIALVDDVLTTGATLDEAARTLRQAGARGVSAWVLARTPAPERPGRNRSPEGGHSMARTHAPPTAP